jgi:predicted nucleic acid-binding protein
MAYKDGETFTTYCDKDYDKHNYRIILTNGKAIVLEDYEVVRAFWYQYRTQVSCVEVIDK